MRPSPIRHCDDCSTPSGDPDGSCHARFFKLSYQAPSELSESFFWRARAAMDTLQSADAPDDARNEALRLWWKLLCAVDARRDETNIESSKRIVCIDKLAATAGLSPIRFYLQEFWLDFRHLLTRSPDPVKKLDLILHGTPKEGNPGRSFNERIEIAAAVEKLRAKGKTLEKACEEIAEKTRNPSIGGDAVRSIYQNANKKEAVLVSLVVAGEVEF